MSKLDVLTPDTKRLIANGNITHDCLCSPGKLPEALCRGVASDALG